jgi:nitroreductase
MKKFIYLIITVILITSFCIPSITVAQDIKLPNPDKKGGKPLMQTISDRQSVRSFTKDPLSLQQLSDLLWAAWGINRADQKMRTAPSARNTQEMDVYVSLPEGLYLYDAFSNILKQVHNRDIRKYTGSQDFVADAPINLIYVADMGKLGKKEGEEIKDSDLLWIYANAGFMAENVYLFCSSANLSCVIRAMINPKVLGPEMGLKSNQRIILSQTVGNGKK